LSQDVEDQPSNIELQSPEPCGDFQQRDMNSDSEEFDDTDVEDDDDDHFGLSEETFEVKDILDRRILVRGGWSLTYFSQALIQVSQNGYVQYLVTWTHYDVPEWVFASGMQYVILLLCFHITIQPVPIFKGLQTINKTVLSNVEKSSDLQRRKHYCWCAKRTIHRPANQLIIARKLGHRHLAGLFTCHVDQETSIFS